MKRNIDVLKHIPKNINYMDALKKMDVFLYCYWNAQEKILLRSIGEILYDK